MKTAYIKPEIVISVIFEEQYLMAKGSTFATVQDENGNFDPITGKVTVIDDVGGPESTAKGGDFFEESITPRSLWGDDEE